MTHLDALMDPGTDHTATTCLACGANPQVGHLPVYPANNPDATDLLVETLTPDTRRTWLISGLKHNLTPARRHRFATQIPELHWVRLVGKTGLPFSVGALVNEIVSRMGIANGLAAVGYSAMGSVPVPDCGCTDVWRCRCDFDTHPFRHADADLWPQYGLIGFKVRYQTNWSLMWLLDTGVAAVLVAEDLTPNRAGTDTDHPPLLPRMVRHLSRPGSTSTRRRPGPVRLPLPPEGSDDRQLTPPSARPAVHNRRSRTTLSSRSTRPHR
jgi:hypothetical protein